MSDELPNVKYSRIMNPADGQQVAELTTIPMDALQPGHVKMENLGTAGNWLISVDENPTATQFQYRLIPGASYTEYNPPKGVWKALNDDALNVAAGRLACKFSYRRA